MSFDNPTDSKNTPTEPTGDENLDLSETIIGKSPFAGFVLDTEGHITKEETQKDLQKTREELGIDATQKQREMLPQSEKRRALSALSLERMRAREKLDHDFEDLADEVKQNAGQVWYNDDVEKHTLSFEAKEKDILSQFEREPQKDLYKPLGEEIKKRICTISGIENLVFVDIDSTEDGPLDIDSLYSNRFQELEDVPSQKFYVGETFIFPAPSGNIELTIECFMRKNGKEFVVFSKNGTDELISPISINRLPGLQNKA